MFYKYIEDLAMWSVSEKVCFPDGTVLDENNKESKDGFVWHETPPQEYLEFLNPPIEE